MRVFNLFWSDDVSVPKVADTALAMAALEFVDEPSKYLPFRVKLNAASAVLNVKVTSDALITSP